MSRDFDRLPDNLIDLYTDYFLEASKNQDRDTIYEVVSEMYHHHLDQGDEFMERIRSSEEVDYLDEIELGPSKYYSCNVYHDRELIGQIDNHLKEFVFISYSGMMGTACPFIDTIQKVNWGQRPEDDLSLDMFIEFDYKVRSNYYYTTLNDLYYYITKYMKLERIRIDDGESYSSRLHSYSTSR